MLTKGWASRRRDMRGTGETVSAQGARTGSVTTSFREDIHTVRFERTHVRSGGTLPEQSIPWLRDMWS